MSIDDIDKFEQNKIKKIRPDPIIKSVGGFKDKIVSPFKTSTSKQAMYGRGKKLNKSEEGEDYYKPKGESNFYNNNFTEYKSNGDRNKSLSLKEYLNKIKPYLRDKIIIIKNLTHAKFS